MDSLLRLQMGKMVFRIKSINVLYEVLILFHQQKKDGINFWWIRTEGQFLWWTLRMKYDTDIVLRDFSPEGHCREDFNGLESVDFGWAPTRQFLYAWEEFFMIAALPVTFIISWDTICIFIGCGPIITFLFQRGIKCALDIGNSA